MGRLLSLNVGLPRDLAWRGRTVHTGIWKRPVQGPRMVRRLNIDGDGQGDLGGHGGVNRAVLVYQAASYDYWRAQVGRDDLTFGAFGENFTVDGLPDHEVCIGDRYRIGEAEFEVSQPRVTCFRLGIRLEVPDMAALLVAHHRPGFYLRVLNEGHVAAGDDIVKIADGAEAMSVAQIDALLYLPDRATADLQRALRIPALSVGWRGSFRDLLTPAAQAAPAWAGFRPLQVRDVIPESASIVSISLEAADGAPLPRAAPGQYLTVRVSGAGEPPPVRTYSLSSEPGAGSYRISVKREAHGLVSGYLHDALKPGALLEAAAPRGQFVLQDNADPVALISAGVGATPVLAMLHELVRVRSTREVWWLHAARGPREHAFAAEARALLDALPAAHEYVYYSAATAAEASRAGAHRGRLDAHVLAGLRLPTATAVYLCGPPAFMAAIRSALSDLGITDVHTELFGPPDAINPGVIPALPVTPHAPVGPPGGGPAITFTRSGLTVPYAERGRPSLLEFAEACDVPTRWSCRTGVCHICATTLLSGDTVYDPAPLEEPTDGTVLLCCARPTSALVLDM